MKNPLVEVLRQSHDDGSALSDSGSFDTSGTVLGPTANDEQVVSDDAIDLELLEATGALILDNGTVRFEAGQAHTSDANQPVASPVAETAIAEVERPPALSRYAPLICVVTALLAALSWTTYRHMERAVASDSLGAEELTNASPLDPFAGTVHLDGAEQFPFINLPADDGVAE